MGGLLLHESRGLYEEHGVVRVSKLQRFLCDSPNTLGLSNRLFSCSLPSFSRCIEACIGEEM